MTKNGRIVLGALGIATAVIGAGLTTTPPRLTMLNSAIEVRYPGTHAAGTWLIAAGLGALAFALPRRPLRIAGTGAALVAAGFGLSSTVYRIEANDTALVAHHALRETRITWPQVTHVESKDASILVQAGAERHIRIDTGALSPDQAAVLDRTIARRVREHSGAARP